MADTSVIFNILAKDNASSVFDKVGSALGHIGEQAAGFVTANLAMGGLGQAFDFAKDAVFEFNATLQDSQIAFTTMLGSGQKAQDFLTQLQAFAKATPFEFEGLVKNAQNMMGMGIAAKDVIPDLRALGDSVASVGGSAEQVDQVTLAFDQMVAKGTLDMGNMDQLLQGGVPNALRILADSYKVTTGQMIAMISTGKVQSSEALPKLISGIEHGTKSVAALGGMMDKQSQTFSGALSNISDGLQQAIAGAFRPFFNVASSAAQALGTFFSSDRFAAFGTKVSAVLDKVVSAVKFFLGFLTGQGSDAVEVFSTGTEKHLFTIAANLNRVYQAIRGALTNVINFVIGTVIPVGKDLAVTFGPLLASVFGTVVVAVKGLSGALQPLGTVLRDVFGFVAQHKTLFQAIAVGIGAVVAAQTAWNVVIGVWSALGRVATAVQVAWDAAMAANPIGLIILAVVALVAAFIYLWTHSAAFRNFFIGLWHGIWDVMKAIGGWFAGPFVNFFVSAAHAIAAPFVWLWQNIIYPVFSMVMRIVTSFANLFTWLATQVLRPIVDNIIRPAFQAIGAVAVWLWQNVLHPAVQAIALEFHWFAEAASWLWHEALEPTFHGIAAVFTWIWDKVISPVFGAVKGAVHEVGDVFRTVFGAIGGFISGAFHGAIGIVKGAINGLVDLINSAVGFINRDVIDKANKVPGVNFPHLATLPHLAQGGIVPATPGGQLVVLGEGGRDEAVVPLPRGGGLSRAGGGGATTMRLSGTTDGAFATALKQMIRNSQITFYDSAGQVVTVT